MASYQPLFTVSVDHAYFADGQWKMLDFIACTASARMMSNAAVLVKRMVNGIVVAHDDERAQALQMYAKDASQGVRFSFKVYAKDRTFARYTAPSIGRENAILRFDNIGKTKDVSTGKVRLSKAGYVSEMDVADIDELIDDGILDFQDKRFPPDFVVSIYCKAESEISSVISDFYIPFVARQSFWKYHLLGGMNRSNMSIVDLDNRVEFEFCGEVVLTGGRPTKVFRSKERLPVQEKSSYRFQLREQGLGNGKVLIRRLPVASESRLGLEVIDGKTEVVLENYVNF